MLKQWAEDTKEELSLANKELTAVRFCYNFCSLVLCLAQ